METEDREVLGRSRLTDTDTHSSSFSYVLNMVSNIRSDGELTIFHTIQLKYNVVVVAAAASPTTTTTTTW